MGVEVAFQTALSDALKAASIGASVYDVAPQAGDGGSDGPFPYVTIGRIVYSELDTQTTNGFAAQCRIHTWSRTGSMLECMNIQGAIYTALHRQSLTVTGFNNFSVLREDSDRFSEADGRIHGVCEYRALIESA